MVVIVNPENKSTNGRSTVPPALARARRFVGAVGYLSPRLGARVARRIWGMPRHYTVPERELNLLTTATKVRIPLDAASLPAWSWGQGPTILLVHGWEGRGGQLAAFAQPLAQRGFRVVAFDAPGHGKNTARESSLFSFADAIAAASRKFGPLHGIVAHSMGCAAAMLALGGGQQVPRVVFVSPADASLAAPRFASMLALRDDVVRHLFRRLEWQYGTTFEDIAIDRLASRVAPISRLLIVHDQDDRFVPLSDARRLAQAWPDAQLKVTVGLGHHRILRDEATIATATDYIDAPSSVRADWQPAPSPGAFITHAEIDRDLHYGRA